MNPQLDLFSTRVYQNELFGAEYITFRPPNNLDNGPIDFIMKDTREYFDLSETMLSLKLKIVNSDDTAIPTVSGKDDVAFVNNVMHSVFSDVQIMINGRSVEGVEDGLYPYKAYIHNLFTYSKDAQAQQLFSQGFVRDEYDKMDAATNSAFLTRKGWNAAGAERKFFGKLICGMFKTNRVLLPHVDFAVRLERAKDAFAIFNTNALLKPKIVIKEAVLHLLALKVNPAIMQHHMQNIARGLPAIYEFNKNEIYTVPVLSNTTEGVKEELFYGRVPKYLMMFMVSNKAFHGDYNSNPFNFKHYALKSLLLTREGENIPYERFHPDFKSGNVLREFMSLYQSNALMGKNAILPINYDEFKSGYTHFQWNLSDDINGV